MDDTISSHPVDDFDAAWQTVGQQYQPAILVTSALIKLTGAGERPVEVERLAATTGRPVDETLALARQMGTLSLALRSLVDFEGKGAPEPATDEKGRRGGINMIRYGVTTMTTPK